MKINKSKNKNNELNDCVELINIFGQKEVWLRRKDFIEGKECDNIQEVINRELDDNELF